MTIELDKKDKRLLLALGQESRRSRSAIARQAGLSKTTLSYRIARLRSQGAIRRFTAAIDLTALGQHPVAILIRCADEPALAKTLAHLRSHPFADWVITLSGEWDLLAELI